MNFLSPEGTLTEAEYDRLAEFLRNCRGGREMNLEELDGFFAALIAGPELVPPSEYLPEVFGGEMSETCEFDTFDEATEFLGLIMRHWNSIAAALSRGDVHLPFLMEDEDGVCAGNDWSRGFIRGTGMRQEAWAELLADEEQGGCMVPVLMLYHEHDEDPDLRPGPIGAKQREEIIVQMAAGLVRAYRYFRQHQHCSRGPHTGAQKVGRNDQCPCGSGKKYKRCCSRSIVN